MAISYFNCTLFVLLVSLASGIPQSASCNALEGQCIPEDSLPDHALSLVQLRASSRISPFDLRKFCAHKCFIKNAKSGRRLFAQIDINGEEGVGAVANGPVADNQLWFIDAVGDDLFTVKNLASGRRLYAQAGQQGENGIGANEVLPIWDDQKWYIEKVGDDEFIFKDFYSSRRLFAQGGKNGKDGLGATDSDGSTADQKWYIVPEGSKAPAAEDLKAWAVPLTWTYIPSPDDGAVEPYGPNKWSLVLDSQACSEVGTQSPINLNMETAVHRDHEKASDLVLTTVGDCTMPTYMLTEKTAEMEYLTEDCSKALMATWLGHEYGLSKITIQSPSEHTFDGGYFPMEVHHVHKDASDAALVVAVMVRVAYEPDKADLGPAAFLLDLISKVPSPGDDKSNNRYQMDIPSNKWNPYRSFIPDLTEGFLYYPGSTTSPPCTSGTLWFIAPDLVTIPSSTLTLFRELINTNPINQLAPFGTIVGGDETDLPDWAPESHMTEWSYILGCNNRPIQNLTGVNNPARVVTLVLPQNKTPIEFFQNRKINTA